MKKVSSFTALGFVLAIIFAAALPARADSVDQRIGTLEAELTRLKAEQVQVKSEQIELKKNALAAEGELPTFSYRAGSGLTITAADKSWGIRMAFESHMRMLFETGKMHFGRTNGEVQGRRFRPRWNFCVVNCFYEIEYSIDEDGFGGSSELQRGTVFVHLEQVNPWLPTAYFGMDIPTESGDFSSGSSYTGWQMEYPLLQRGLINTGSASNGIAVRWNDKPLGAIGIPGKINTINLVMAAVSDAGDGLSTFHDAGGNMLAYISIDPFSELKSKWLEGLSFEMGAWFCKVDGFDSESSGGGGSATTDPDQDCSRLRLRDNGDGGRTTLFDTGSRRLGRGLMHYLYPGVQWEVGPYTLRFAAAFARWHNGDAVDSQNGRPGLTKGNSWNIAHDLFLFSPKGWLTGSARTPGSVLVGTRFERTTADCNVGGGQSFGSGGCTGAGFNRNVVLVREWGVYYFLMSGLSTGINWTWYDAKNMPNSSRVNLGIDKSNDRLGKGGSWVDVALNFRYRF